ncbi:DUF4124 domain-containing protein [Sediminicurvatus halobius]|uniref:DUF4124 domain-containing protein n=1 Tax=Sediminicurvatus halobius TaxID=2182432 RepID=A0A2U2MYB2_9GAMM|nr:DUF4124 domain-containing protein [Spiribacter halobius]PWG61782.1 hypothetical protein DEM34_15055 [Spiribacter halobius]UEX76783.1 DUF4124 domain-containing protein [Spiribacter halobius]
MMRYSTLIAAAVLALPVCASAQIYRCETESGTVFSQAPCAPDAERVEGDDSYDSEAAAKAEARTQRIMSDWQRERQQRLENRARWRAEQRQEREAERRREELNRQARRGNIQRGADCDVATSAAGRPDRVNEGSDARGEWQQYVYEDGGQTRYVHCRDGKVTSSSRWGGD